MAYKATEVPEQFSVRTGKRKECKIPIGPLAGKARTARLIVSTWSAAHGDELTFKLKLAERSSFVHNYSFDVFPLPVGNIKQGDNVFSIFSRTEHRALEVNWPGPMLVVEYQDASLFESPR